MFHVVKNDPIPFSVMSLTNCCSFYLRVSARSAIKNISHINVSMKTAIVCCYCQIIWQHKSNKNKTKTKHNMCWTPLCATKHTQCTKAPHTHSRSPIRTRCISCNNGENIGLISIFCGRPYRNSLIDNAELTNKTFGHSQFDSTIIVFFMFAS